MRHMLPVLGCNDHDVGKLLLLQHLFGAGKTCFLRHVEFLCRKSDLFTVNIRNGYDLHLVRMKLCRLRIGLPSSVSQSCNSYFHWFTHLFFPSFYNLSVIFQ
jgi:hypothetical protein